MGIPGFDPKQLMGLLPMMLKMFGGKGKEQAPQAPAFSGGTAPGANLPQGMPPQAQGVPQGGPMAGGTPPIPPMPGQAQEAIPDWLKQLMAQRGM
jgi:hypothetical protein